MDLLFIHWEIEYQDLRRRIPEGLEVDLYDGKAWIAIVPFDMKEVTLRHCPAISSISNFPEINVRTYVVRDGKPGVWFFSLDVTSRLAVWAARNFFHLPYRHGDVKIEEKSGIIQYNSQVGEEDRFVANYHPISKFSASEDSFEQWATERYCLYCQSKRGRLYRAEVHHRQWPLQKAEVEIESNTLLNGFNTGDQHPSALFSKSVDVVAYSPKPLL